MGPDTGTPPAALARKFREVFPETGSFIAILLNDFNYSADKSAYFCPFSIFADVTEVRHATNILMISLESGKSQTMRLAFDLLASALTFKPLKLEMPRFTLRQILPQAK